jgi:hypothetical protein
MQKGFAWGLIRIAPATGATKVPERELVGRVAKPEMIAERFPNGRALRGDIGSMDPDQYDPSVVHNPLNDEAETVLLEVRTSHTGRISVARIAHNENMPPKFVESTLSQLRGAGLVDADKKGWYAIGKL